MSTCGGDWDKCHRHFILTASSGQQQHECEAHKGGGLCKSGRRGPAGVRGDITSCTTLRTNSGSKYPSGPYRLAIVLTATL